MRRTVRLLSGEQYFDDKLSIFVNRNIESYELTEHHHDFLEFSYVSEGTGTHHTGDEVTNVSAGDLFLIPEGLSHVFRPASLAKDRQLIVYNCIVTTEAAARLLRAVPGGEELQRLLSLPSICQLRDQTGEAHRLFMELHREFAALRVGRQSALFAGLLQLLVFIARLQEASSEEPIVPISTGLDEILVLLHRDFAATFTVGDLASRLGIGERQFQRLFQQHTGLTLTGYVQRVRIQVACRLLAATNRKIADIAGEVGYTHTPFFNELFKKQMGVSPRTYRHAATNRTE